MLLLISLFASITGLWASWRIFKSKQEKKKMVCPLRASCDVVIKSSYSKTLGINNEVIGILYFSLVSLLLSVIFLNGIHAGILATLLVLVTASALFSIYLIFVQLFTLKAWCSWCLLIASVNISLWFMIHSLVNVEVLAQLAQTKSIWIMIHNLGFILGVGGATITDIFFFRFLKDFRISAEEKETLDSISQIIWFGLTMLVVSGYLLYLPRTDVLLNDPRFVIKMLVVLIIIINGIFLNLKISPELVSLSFQKTKPARKLRKLSFSLGAISIISWYSAFLLGSVRSLKFPFSMFLLIYIVVLVGGIILSQIFEEYLTKKANKIMVQNLGLKIK